MGNLLATVIYDSKRVSSSDVNNKKLAKSDFIKPIYIAKEFNFLTPDIRWAFTQLRQVFTKTFILQHFDTERYIRIETNVSGYTIGSVPS